MIYLQLSLLCFLVFCRSIPGPVRVHDDQISIVQPMRDGLYAASASRWWQHFWNSDRTLYFLFNAWNWRLAGFYPPAWHLVNYALHALACSALYLTLSRLNVSNADWLAVAFAVHPFQTHSVNYISGRSGILAGLFILLGINVYLLPFPWACLSVLPFWLAFKTREDSIVFLMWLPALEWLR